MIGRYNAPASTRTSEELVPELCSRCCIAGPTAAGAEDRRKRRERTGLTVEYARYDARVRFGQIKTSSEGSTEWWPSCGRAPGDRRRDHRPLGVGQGVVRDGLVVDARVLDMFSGGQLLRICGLRDLFTEL